MYEYLNAGQGFSVEDVKSLKAICSDGRIYLNDWQEIRNNIEQEATISKGVMAIGYLQRFHQNGFQKLRHLQQSDSFQRRLYQSI